MSPFRTQLRHEWRHQRRRPFVWFCCLAYFGLAFSDTVRMGWSGHGHMWINGAGLIGIRAIILSILGVIASAGVIGDAFSRDRRTGIEATVLGTGASRITLGLARLLVCLGVVIGASLCFVPGMILGAMVPGIPPEVIGPVELTPYLKATGIYLIPNVIITSSIVFVVAVRWRNQTAAFGAAVGLIAFYRTSRMLLGRDVYRHDVFERYALLDPYGSIASAEHAMGWTVTQANENFVPFIGLMVTNRLLWLGIASVLIAIGIARLPLQPAAPRVKRGWLRRLLPRPSRRWPGGFLGALRHELRAILRHPGVRVALLFMAYTLWRSAAGSGTHLFTLPSTDLLVSETDYYFERVLALVVVWAAADVLWRERRSNVAPLLDVLPTHDALRLGAKAAALGVVVLAFWTLSIIVGLIYQRSRGYTDHELGLFLVDSFLVKAPYYLWIAGLALAAQIIVRRRLIAIGVALLAYISPLALDAFSIHHPMLRFGEVSFFWYSLMDGYGHFWPAHWAMVGWWTLTVWLLGVVAWGCYERGEHPRPRRLLWKRRLGRGRGRVVLLTSTLLWVGYGGWLAWQSAVVRPWPPMKKDAVYAEIERTYGAEWRGRLQPRVEGITLDITLDTHTRTMRSNGALTLINRGDAPIPSLMLMRHPGLSVETLNLGARGTLQTRDPLGVQIWTLTPPLAPGDQLDVTFDLRRAPPPGIEIHAEDDGVPVVGEVEVIGNGTALLNLRLFPAVGYTDRVEHKPRWKRRKYGLPLEWTAPAGEWARNQGHATLQLGWVKHFDVTLRTPADQIGLHGAERVETRVEDGWRISRFRNTRPVRGWSPILSGRYAIHRAERPGVVPVELYHDPRHTWTLDAWSAVLLDTLEHFEARYGPPPMSVLRLGEHSMHTGGYNGRAGMARASEIFGWKTDLALSGGADLELYASRMVGGIYFGDAIIPANVAGAKVIHSGLPYWVAALYLHQRRDAATGRRLRMQAMREAFRARRALEDVELPFAEEFKHSGIVRKKGQILILYLAELVGVERLEAVLARFRERWRYQGPPFPTVTDFLTHLRGELPAEVHPQIHDIFEKVTTWQLKITDARAWPDGERWQVEIEVDARKRYTRGLGEQDEAELNTPIFVGVFASRGFAEADRIEMRREDLPTGASTLRWTVDRKPVQVAIDPYLLLPDLRPQDNVRAVTLLEKAP